MGVEHTTNGWCLQNNQNMIGPRNMINRVEYIRILEQALAHLGYTDLAAALERDSGVVMQPPTATAFREAVMSGNFAAALELIPTLGPSPSSMQRARFLLLRRKYIEAVAAGDMPAALHCLRHEMQPLQTTGPGDGSDTLHGLAALLVSPAGRLTGNLTAGRETLLGEIQALLPPSLLVPEARLEELVEQALLSQLERCPYHNSRALRMSLFTDYVAGPEQLPTQEAQVLTGHTDEVWAVQFSSDGRWMATAGKDGTALLWSVGDRGEVRLERTVLHIPRTDERQPQSTVNIIAFSPDNLRLLVGGNDGKLRVYDVATGSLQMEALCGADGREGGDPAVSAAVWLPDSRRAAVAAGNRELQVMDMSSGMVLERFSLGQHTYDIVLSRDGGTVIAVGQDRRLRFLRLADRREVFLGPAPVSVTCLSPCPDGRFIAANLSNGSIQLWPLGDLRAPTEPPTATPARPGGSDPLDALPAQPLQEFHGGEGHPGRFVIRSAFGGAGYAFLASGSEGAHLHIWHRESGELLASLEGHTGTVNAVAWNPRNQYMLVSVSDDHSVRVWLAPSFR